jgi:hypothetical protein
MKKIYFMMFSLMAVGYTYAQEEPTTVTDTTEPMPATPVQEAPKPEEKLEVKPGDVFYWTLVISMPMSKKISL